MTTPLSCRDCFVSWEGDQYEDVCWMCEKPGTLGAIPASQGGSGWTNYQERRFTEASREFDGPAPWEEEEYLATHRND